MDGGEKIMRIKAQISSSKLSRVRAGVSNNSKFINNFGCLIFLSVSYFDVFFFKSQFSRFDFY